jgi:FkbM family methyltransferase
MGLIIKILIFAIALVILFPIFTRDVLSRIDGCSSLARPLLGIMYILSHFMLMITPLNKEVVVHNAKFEGNTMQSTLIKILYLTGRYEPNLTHYLLDKPINPNPIFVDIGANEGYFTMIMAAKGYKVYAIEPSPVNARILRNNVKINGFEDRVTVIEAAVSDHKGELVFTENLVNRMWSGVQDSLFAFACIKINVKCDTLDNLVPGLGAAIIKIDVEGHTLEVMKGAKNTLADSSIEWLIELDTKLENDREVYQLLKDQGREVLRAKMNSLAFCDDRELERVRPGVPVAVFDNFIFLPVA